MKIQIRGRLNHSPLRSKEKNHLILHKHNHVSILFVHLYHEKEEHQGRHFTEAASKELELNKLQQEERVHRYLSEQNCSCEFNPPHSSHRGGSWEHMIGVALRILNCILLREHAPFSNEVLCTLMTEVSAIINARPFIPVSTDPQSPFILTPAMLLTQKGAVLSPPGEFSDRDLLNQWRQAQALANEFWHRWKREYLPTLQSRRKWHEMRHNLQEGDIILLKDNQAAHNMWPMAVVTSAIHSQDGKVRTVNLRTTAQGTPKTFTRPITEVVLLLPSTD